MTKSRMISIRKAGTRLGKPHYTVECRACRSNYGKPTILASYKSKETADRLAIEHTTQYGCGR